MSVYNRRLFFNRGGYAHRGTGIVSGLTPVQKFQTGGQVDPMDAYRQAVYSGMMSGKTKQGPIGGFLDVLGQSTGAAVDLILLKQPEHFMFGFQILLLSEVFCVIRVRVGVAG